MGCGSGKTAIASFIAKQMSKKGKQLLFLVHRQELESQTWETFSKFNITDENIKVGMVITVSHRLEKYNPDVIICDECNFALAKTWRTVLEAYPNAIRIGLSATPVRLSGEPMGDIFDDIIEVIPEAELIKMGYLSDYDYYAPKVQFDISEIKNKGSDYNAKDIERILSKPKIYGDVISHYKKLADGRKTIVYCATIQHSMETAEQFRSAGYNAMHFDGNTPDNERKDIIERFKNDEIKILCNVDLISFGFDCPDCDCVILLRPTQSTALYIQQSCRCLRFKENKRAIILDFVGNVHRFGMPTDKRTYSLEGKVKSTNVNAEPDILARQCRQCLKVYSGTSPICPYCGADNGRTKKQIEQDEKAELERIEAVQKREKRKEVGMAKTKSDLIRIAKERHYKMGWVWQQMRIKNIRE